VAMEHQLKLMKWGRSVISPVGISFISSTARDLTTFFFIPK